MQPLIRCARPADITAEVPREKEEERDNYRKSPELHSKHKRLLPLYDLVPELGEKNYLAHNACLVGEIYTDNSVNIWDRAVIRGDLNAVRIGFMVSIREGVSISTVGSLPNGTPSIVSIGKFYHNKAPIR